MVVALQPWRATLSSPPIIPQALHRVRSIWGCLPCEKVLRVGPICWCIVAGEKAQIVRPPPPDYDFRAATLGTTLETVQSLHPELLDLVENGTLVVVRRPVDYVERRSDGYVEPEVVYIVGTAHMSRVSAAQVRRVVNAVQPENVVVELCRSRAGIMYDKSPASEIQRELSDGKQQSKNLMSMSGDSFGSAVGRSLKLGGRSALALRLLLAGASERISTSAGVPTGEEFRAARKAAEEIGAQIVLGDRPIEITVEVACTCIDRLADDIREKTDQLQRAWEALRWDERLRFGITLLQGTSAKNLDASEECLEALKSDDALSAMFAEISDRFPSLLQPLIHERDMYLAWSMKRSKAVNGCKCVVGVVGKGHLRGIVHALMHDQENLRFKDLVGARGTGREISKGRKLHKILKNLAIETAVGCLIWWAWESIHQ